MTRKFGVCHDICGSNIVKGRKVTNGHGDVALVAFAVRRKLVNQQKKESSSFIFSDALIVIFPLFPPLPPPSQNKLHISFARNQQKKHRKPAKTVEWMFAGAFASAGPPEDISPHSFLSHFTSLPIDQLTRKTEVQWEPEAGGKRDREIHELHNPRRREWWFENDGWIENDDDDWGWKPRKNNNQTDFVIF